MSPAAYNPVIDVNLVVVDPEALVLGGERTGEGGQFGARLHAQRRVDRIEDVVPHRQPVLFDLHLVEAGVDHLDALLPEFTPVPVVQLLPAGTIRRCTVSLAC
jgi:hypothetical protein